jgi:hypothetical protein
VEKENMELLQWNHFNKLFFSKWDSDEIQIIENCTENFINCEYKKLNAKSRNIEPLEKGEPCSTFSTSSFAKKNACRVI